MLLYKYKDKPYFNACTMHLFFIFYHNQQMHNCIIKVYIKTVSLCNLYSYMF